MKLKGVAMLAATVGLAILAARAWGCFPPIGIEEELGKDGASISGRVRIKVRVREDVTLSSVEFFVAEESLGKDTTAPYSLKWDTTTVKDGEHQLKVVGTDKDGEEVKSKVVEVTVDNSAA